MEARRVLVHFARARAALLVLSDARASSALCTPLGGFGFLPRPPGNRCTLFGGFTEVVLLGRKYTVTKDAACGISLVRIGNGLSGTKRGA